MKYTTLLFDSDDTLLDFAAAEKHALAITFSSFAQPVNSMITAITSIRNTLRFFIVYPL